MRSVLSEAEVQRLIEALSEDGDISPEVKAAGERFMEKFNSGYFDNYCPDEAGPWRSVKKEGLPENDGYYLCTVGAIPGNLSCRFVKVLGFSKDLHSVDAFDFRENVGQPGFYGSDREFGYYKQDDVVAWMPLPEEYKGE